MKQEKQHENQDTKSYYQGIVDQVVSELKTEIKIENNSIKCINIIDSLIITLKEFNTLTEREIDMYPPTSETGLKLISANNKLLNWCENIRKLL